MKSQVINFLSVDQAMAFAKQTALLAIVVWNVNCALGSLTRALANDLPNPYPASTKPIGQATVWRFPEDAKSWRAVRECAIEEAKDDSGRATVFVSKGIDPILVRSIEKQSMEFEVTFVCRAASATSAQLFWDNSGKDRFNESDSRRFELLGDNQWHEYRVRVAKTGVQSLRFDPADSPVSVEIREIRFQSYQPPELEIPELQWLDDEQLQIRIKSFSKAPIEVVVSAGIAAELGGPAGTGSEEKVSIEPEKESTVTLRIPTQSAEADAVRVVAKSTNSIAERTTVRLSAMHQILAGQAVDSVLKGWSSIESPSHSLRISPAGSSAILLQRGKAASDLRFVACLAPLSWDRQQIERMTVSKSPTSSSNPTESSVKLHSDNSTIELSLSDGKLDIVRQSKSSAEGPVLRIPGKIEQALLAGVEHLGSGEASSSDIDITTDDRFRYEPPPYHLTMQLAAVVTGSDRIGFRWKDPLLQPVFATPNFFDGAKDTRIALRGSNVAATIALGTGWDAGGRIEDSVAEYISARGLPIVAQPARDIAEQDQLNLAGLFRSELYDKDRGWYHAILPGSHGMPKSAQWFGDHASAVLALGKRLPADESQIARGGSHIANDRWMFLTGRAEQWSQSQSQQLRSLIPRQQPDGSVVYDGQWSVGHFEKTSSGQCGMVAEQLMNIAWMTGNAEARQAGLKTLEYCNRFRTPRGAQVWECPLHAPDIMASAHLARAYTIAFQLTGNAEYQKLAVRWALSGLPFVYQWQESPQASGMPYSTIATLCATHRVAPLWIGRPVQWCGIVYADAVLDVAQIDASIPWKQVAEGIYRSSTYQQYSSGPSIGLLPDSVTPSVTRRFPYDINPATVVLLGHRLQGRAVRLETASVDGKQLVSPWPIVISDEAVTFKTDSDAASEEFQIAIDGVVQNHKSGAKLTRPLK